jgi:hypothetical protein
LSFLSTFLTYAEVTFAKSVPLGKYWRIRPLEAQSNCPSLCIARYASKQRLAWLRDAVEEAQVRRKGLPVKIRGGLVTAPDEEL